MGFPDKNALYEETDLIHGYNRPRFQETMDDMGKIREGFKKLRTLLIDTCPLSRELSMALSHLDEGSMCAIASLARHEPEGETPNATSHPDPVRLAYVALAVRREHATATDDEIIDIIKEQMADPKDPGPYPLTHDGRQQS